MRIKKEIHAVHDDHLEVLLKGLGLMKKLERGEMKCKFCKTPITLENLCAIFPEAGTIKIVCDQPICVTDLSAHLREHEL